MDFELTAEQKALRRTIREFARAEIAPHAAQWDARGEFPVDVVRQLGALGVMGLPFPEEWGGVGAGATELALAIEELARVDSSVAITVSANVGLAGAVLHQFASAAQNRCFGCGVANPAGRAAPGALRMPSRSWSVW